MDERRTFNGKGECHRLAEMWVLHPRVQERAEIGTSKGGAGDQQEGTKKARRSFEAQHQG